jgi:hypothetical protein
MTSLYMGLLDRDLIVADNKHGLSTWLKAVLYLAVLDMSLTMRWD